MNHFSISQLGRFAGLKPHTIRAWEARYNALRPSRSGGNTRFYDSSQMKRLLNMASLVNAGYRASEVAMLTDDRLHQLLETIVGARRNATEEYFISQLIAAGMTYDEARFEQIYSICVARYRLKKTYQSVLLPMLERIGLLWRCDRVTPAQEHFVSNLLRKKFFASIDSLPTPDAGSDRWLLFLPENEFHELGLLLACNLIRLSGHQVVYLGANVPLFSLSAAIRDIQPDRLLLFTLQRQLPNPVQAFLRELEPGFGGKRIYVTGAAAKPVKTGGCCRVQWLSTVDELTAALNGPE